MMTSKELREMSIEDFTMLDQVTLEGCCEPDSFEVYFTDYDAEEGEKVSVKITLHASDYLDESKEWDDNRLWTDYETLEELKELAIEALEEYENEKKDGLTDEEIDLICEGLKEYKSR